MSPQPAAAPALLPLLFPVLSFSPPLHLPRLSRVGQRARRGVDMTYVSQACCCATPVSSSPSSPWAVCRRSQAISCVTIEPMAHTGRPCMCVPCTILHPGYKVLPVADDERKLQNSANVVLLSVQCRAVCGAVDFP